MRLYLYFYRPLAGVIDYDAIVTNGGIALDTKMDIHLEADFADIGTCSGLGCYDPFTTATVEQIAGMELDYFGRRYYDPSLGMWTSTDPAEQFWGGYSYAANGYNPVNAIDPDGKQMAPPLPPPA